MYVEYLKLCPSRVRQREREKREMEGEREGELETYLANEMSLNKV